jgi:TPR repeat protein
MAHFDFTGPVDCGDRADAVLGEGDATTGTLVERGLMYASGRSVPTDLVAAHKWFNIAAMRGDREAVRLRREVAFEMSDAEIGAAQRAARGWMKTHPQALRQAPELRAAA